MPSAAGAATVVRAEREGRSEVRRWGEREVSLLFMRPADHPERRLLAAVVVCSYGGQQALIRAPEGRGPQQPGGSGSVPAPDGIPLTLLPTPMAGTDGSWWASCQALQTGTGSLIYSRIVLWAPPVLGLSEGGFEHVATPEIAGFPSGAAVVQGSGGTEAVQREERHLLAGDRLRRNAPIPAITLTDDQAAALNYAQEELWPHTGEEERREPHGRSKRFSCHPYEGTTEAHPQGIDASTDGGLKSFLQKG